MEYVNAIVLWLWRSTTKFQPIATTTLTTVHRVALQAALRVVLQVHLQADLQEALLQMFLMNMIVATGMTTCRHSTINLNSAAQEKALCLSAYAKLVKPFAERLSV